MNGLAPKHLMPEDSILWDATQVIDWELEEALRFGPGTHPLDQASFYVPHPLYEWQHDAISAVCFSHSRAILSSNNESGKTSTLIVIVGLAMMAAFPGCQICSTSGDERQVREQLFEQQLKPMVNKEHFKKAGWKIKVGESMKVSAPNGSTWLGYVSQRDSTFEGFHSYWREDDKTGEKRYCPLIFIVDEAKSVSDGVFEAIGRIDPDFLLAVSTPGVESGWFHDGIDPDHLRVKNQASGGTAWNRYDHPYDPNPIHDYREEWADLETTDIFTYRRVITWEECPHLHTEKKRIERMKKIKKYGRESAYVKSTLFGEFQRSEDANLVFSEDDLDAMKRAMRGQNKPIGKDVAAAGDPSGGGDGQILNVRLGTEILLQDDTNSGSGIKQAKYWVPLLRGLGIHPWQFYMDSAGLGAEVANYIEDDLGYSGIVRIQPNVGPRFKHEFKDKYTEVLFFIKELLSADVLKLAYNENLLKQMRCRRFVEMDGHRVKAEDKKVHRKREKSSPDELDDLIYVFWEFERSLLDTHNEIKIKTINEDDPTPMEQEAAAGTVGGQRAFSNLKSAAGVRARFANDSRMQKLRIGRR